MSRTSASPFSSATAFPSWRTVPPVPTGKDQDVLGASGLIQLPISTMNKVTVPVISTA